MTWNEKRDKLKKFDEYGNFTPEQNLDRVIKDYKETGHFHIFISPRGDIYNMYKPFEFFHAQWARIYYQYVYHVSRLGTNFLPLAHAVEKVKRYTSPESPLKIQELGKELTGELKAPDFFLVNHEGFVKVTLDKSIDSFLGVIIPEPFLFGQNLKRAQIDVLNELVVKGVLPSSLPEQLLNKRRHARSVGAQLDAYDKLIQNKK